MAGLNLSVGSQVRGTAQAAYGNPPNPTTASEAGFGQGASPSSDGGSLLGFLIPNDAPSLLFWRGVVFTGVLWWIWYSLPG